MANFVRTPWQFWAIAVLGVVWFAMGAFDYVMTSIQHEGYMSQLTEPQRIWLDNRPLWFTAAWATSVWASFLGAVLVLFKSGRSVAFFWVSLLTYLVACMYSYGLSDPGAFDITGWFGVAFSVVIGLTIVFFTSFSATQRTRGVLR